MNQTFGKGYKLCSHVLIEKLFKDGEKFRDFPFLINYLGTESLSGSKDFNVLILTLFYGAIDAYNFYNLINIENNYDK